MRCVDSGTFVVTPITVTGRAHCGNCGRTVNVRRDPDGTPRMQLHGNQDRCPICGRRGLQEHDHDEHDYQERRAAMEVPR